VDELMMQLVVARGWSEELDPRHPVFLDRLRAAGVDVLDVYSSPDGFRTFDDWIASYVDTIVELVPDREQPLRCLGYCVGGSILIGAAELLRDRGYRIDYVGLVDARVETTLQRLAHNIHHRAKVPRRIRLRYFMRSVGAPFDESVRQILRAWVSARIRTAGSLFTKGPRFLRRRREAAWPVLHLSYSAKLPPGTLPHHRYVARESVELYGDPSLNAAGYSHGGYVLRIIGGDHFTCITDPHVDGLVQAIVDDLRDPLSIWLEVDKGQRRPAPRSDR